MKLILFDLDWTLVYTGGAGVRALDYAFERIFKITRAMEGVTPDGKTDAAIVREMIRTHFARAPLKGEIEAVCRGYLDRLRVEISGAEGYRILPGIPELLAALAGRSDALVGLGTGNLEEGAQIKLAPSGLLPYLRFGGFGSDHEDRAQLLATGVQRGEKRLGRSVPPRDVVIVGDNRRDVEAGKAIGVTTIAVATGPMGYEELARCQPDGLFKDFSDTGRVLEAFFP